LGKGSTSYGNGGKVENAESRDEGENFIGGELEKAVRKQLHHYYTYTIENLT
jgi:hypothetical protein